MHLQKTLNSEETVGYKKAFEAYIQKVVVNIRHYHTKNGRFQENLFMKLVKDERRAIYFCGVNAHFKIGKAEKRIRN